MPRGRKKKWKRAKLSKRKKATQSLPINEDALAHVLSFVSLGKKRISGTGPSVSQGVGQVQGQDKYAYTQIVSKDFYKCLHESRHDELIWKHRCMTLWKNKTEMAWKKFMDMPKSIPWQHRMRLSISDSTRCSLTPNELCSMEFGMRSRDNGASTAFNPAKKDPYWTFYHALLSTDCGMEVPVAEQQILQQYPKLRADDRFKFNPAAVSRSFLADGTIQIPNGVNDDMQYQPHERDGAYRWKFCTTRWNGRSSTTAGGPFLSICNPENYGGRPSQCEIRRTESWGWMLYPNYEGCPSPSDEMVFVYPKSDMVKLHNAIGYESEYPVNYNDSSDEDSDNEDVEEFRHESFNYIHKEEWE